MNRILRMAMLLAGAWALLAAGEGPAGPTSMPASRFSFVDVFVETGSAPLAAWQFEFSAPGGGRLVGIERGDARGFQDPPYYDPAALAGNRVIVAAFNTGNDLPAGRVRVARLHLWRGDAAPLGGQVRLMAAGGRDGQPIPATASFTEGESR